jgi:serine/threonine protein kinase
MVTAELGACEWFVYELRRSNLIERSQLDQVVGEFLKRNPRAEPPALAQFLVDQGILSQFQAERVLSNKAQGLVLGPYVLIDAIGSGSMGTVYKANSKTDGKAYAVKVLPRRSMWNVRLARRQVRSFSQFNHPAVVPFVDVGTSGGMHYLVWPLVEGETLEALVQRQGRLTPEQTALVGLQIANGLTVCHGNGLFHGLLKPSNVMVGPDLSPAILDFGIGSLLVENEGESLVDTMSTANTLTSGLDCASPESIMEPTNRTPAGDQYSLGCLLYYCLCGRCPFPEGSAVEKMMAHQFKQPTPVKELAPDAPDKLVAVIERLMQKTPEARYRGADEIVDELQPLASNLAARQKPAAVPDAGSALPRRSQLISSAGPRDSKLAAPRQSRSAPAAKTGHYAPAPPTPAAPAPPVAPARPAAPAHPPVAARPPAAAQPPAAARPTVPGRPAVPAQPPAAAPPAVRPPHHASPAAYPSGDAYPAAYPAPHAPVAMSSPDIQLKMPRRGDLHPGGGPAVTASGYVMPPGFVNEQKPANTISPLLFAAVGMSVMVMAYVALAALNAFK